MNKLSTVKGFADMFPPESSLFTYMEEMSRKVFGAYGYKEVRIPILEYTELFSRSIGTETDVVQKEMFTFPDRKNRSLTMRPEATAGLMRAFIAEKGQEGVAKYLSFGPMFRYERPQKGRMRQFHQIDCECLGAHEPEADAEMILMLMHFLHSLGLQGLVLEINTLGCKECRPAYKEKLASFLGGLDVQALCEDCQRRLHTNPLRVLDCKVPACKEQTVNAPNIADNVCEHCDKHFAKVLGMLDSAGLEYKRNNRLVRGLDYYMRTTFEVVSTSIGAQGSVAGGGRYDGLIQQLGGADVPGIGFACGMERLAMMVPAEMVEHLSHRPDFYIAPLAEKSEPLALALAQKLRKAGLCGELSFASKGIKSLMRSASKTGAKACLLLGQSEVDSGQVLVKNMDTGTQTLTNADDVQALVAAILQE